MRARASTPAGNRSLKLGNATLPIKPRRRKS
jgi:hypothetical protein